MARSPSGPLGNSPRDVRDDAVGVPADDIRAPEPPRWPRKPKRVTTNTFHAKVSGDTSVKRADRKPHFRRGGFVRGFASGGSVEERREEKPGEDKNDPYAKQNLRGGGNVKKKADGGEIRDPYRPPEMPDRPFEHTGSIPERPVPPLPERNTAGKVAQGINTINRTIGRPPNLGAASVQRYDDMKEAQAISDLVPRRGSFAGPGGIGSRKSGGGVTKRQDGGGVQLPGKLRSESTEVEKARRGFEKNPKDTDAALKMIRTEDQTGVYLPRRSTGEGRYKDGGKLSAAQRQSLPRSDFALPGKGEGPKGAGSGSYPINDPSHAKNALARASGKPVEAKVRAAVHRKYPGIGQK